MVFAAKLPIRIYGTGTGQASITFAGQAKTVVSHKAHWLVEFPPMEYGGPYTLTFTAETASVSFCNIYIGEVFLFAGQSNMELKLKETNTDPSSYESNKNVRLLPSTDDTKKAAIATMRQINGRYVKKKRSVSGLPSVILPVWNLQRPKILQ